MPEALLHATGQGYIRSDDLDHAIGFQDVNIFDSIRFYGLNNDVDAGTEDVWTGGGEYVFPDSAGEAMFIASTDINDTESGSGAEFVTVFGMDADGELMAPTIVMDGQTPVSVGTLSRVLKLFVQGSQANLGIIRVGNGTFTTGNPVNNFAQMEIGRNTNETAIGTVPNGFKGLLTRWRASIRGVADKSAEVSLWAKDNGVFILRDSATISVTKNPTYVEEFKFGLHLPALTDVVVKVTTTDTDVQISATLEVLLKSLTIPDSSIIKVPVV